jgi:membrane-associated phospholipid phosphatase
MRLSDFISLSVGGLYILPIISYLYTNNIYHIKGLVGLITTTILSEFIKYNIIGEKSIRPLGASNCNLFCNDGNQENKPGMPSSHTASSVFFTSYYYSFTNNTYIRALLVVYTASVMLSRYIKRCHTIIQIGTGALFGYLMSLFFSV